MLQMRQDGLGRAQDFFTWVGNFFLNFLTAPGKLDTAPTISAVYLER